LNEPTLRATTTRSALLACSNEWLQPNRFKDYCPNGLQVEGSAQVRSLVSGVTASLALIEAAIEHGADAILVHHGLFWRGQDATITGWMRERVAKLIENNINLIAYHLPLDAHEQYGNNAQLALQLGLQTQSTFGDQNLGHLGVNLDPLSQHNFTTANLAARVSKALGKEPLVIDPSPGRTLQNIAWCTGGAQSWFEDAIKAGADAFITGEISEPQAHLARESGVAFLACGHHATERGGARALGEALAQKFEINHLFIDINNPA